MDSKILDKCTQRPQSVDKGPLMPETVYIDGLILGPISEKMLPGYTEGRDGDIHGTLLLSEYEIRALAHILPGVGIRYHPWGEGRGIPCPVSLPPRPFILEITGSHGWVIKKLRCAAVVGGQHSSPIPADDEPRIHRVYFEGTEINPEPIWFDGDLKKCCG